MLIMMNRLQEQLGDEGWQNAARLERAGAVREEDASAGRVALLVMTTPPHRVILDADGTIRCTCQDFAEHGACVHLAAAAIRAKRDGTLTRLEQTRAAAAAPMLLGSMDAALPTDDRIRMEVTLLTDPFRVGLRIGEDRLYVVRSIPQLLETIEQRGILEFSRSFTFHGEWMRFGEAEERVLDLLRSFLSARTDTGALRGAALRLLELPPVFVGQLLELLQELPFRFGDDTSTAELPPVRMRSVPMRFRVSGTLNGLTFQGSLPRDFRPLLRDCTYAVAGSGIIRVDPRQLPLVRTMVDQQRNGSASFFFDIVQVPRVINELLPFLKRHAVVDIDPAVERMLEKQPLTAQVYLDRAGREVQARTRFVYGSRTIDPFHEAPPPAVLGRGEKLLLRDGVAERRVLDALGSAGFRVDHGEAYLSGDERIYAFVNEGLPKLQQLCEVFVSRELQRMQPRRPQLHGAMRLTGGHLELTMEEEGRPSEELLGIMEALARRKDYFRLKDGTFLDLTQMDKWQPLADAVAASAQAEGAETQGTTLSLSASRLYYLSSLLEHGTLPVDLDSSITEAAARLESEEDIALPSGLSLRSYQQRGFAWLHTLDALHLGGILADDMGLGKTVQVIALMKSIHHEEQEEHPLSLVVSPTSLTYNWLS